MHMRVLYRVFILIGMAVAVATAAPGLSFSGSMYADMQLLHDYRSIDTHELDFSGTSRLSLLAQNTDRRYAKVVGDLDVVLLYGVAAKTSSARDVGSDSYEMALFSALNAPVLLDLRRFYLEFYLPFADIALGRQIVNFGKGFVFSPTDVFSTVEVFDLDLRRRGSDVAVVRVPLGTLSGLDAIVEFPHADGRFATATKFFTTFGDFDMSLVGIYRHPGGLIQPDREGVIGATFKGDLLVGFYGEAVIHLLEHSPRAYAEAMCGVDYSIRSRWLLRAEYLYVDFQWPHRIWGEHNLFVSLQYLPTELLTLSANLLYDFEHELGLGTALLRYNIIQNVNIETYVRGFTGIPLLPYDFAYGTRVEVAF